MHAASGGGWGGILVDEAFQELLQKLLGPKVYEQFMKEETEDWLEIWRTFELKKKTVDPSKHGTINMRFPHSLQTLNKKLTKHHLEDALKETTYAMEVELRKDKMMFSSNLMKSLFEKSIKKTVSCVKEILHDINSVECTLMVGGFSESPMLKEAIKKEFPNLKVICPRDAASIVMRGAVIFGHNPCSVTHRVLKKTYGVEVDNAFIHGVHPINKLKLIEGRAHCMKMFDKHVEVGQTVTVGEAQVERLYFPSANNYTTEELIIYASDLKNPTFVDEGCTLVGQMTIDISRIPKHLDRLEKQIKISLCFSDTEIKATTRIVSTGQIITGKFDFLG